MFHPPPIDDRSSDSRPETALRHPLRALLLGGLLASVAIPAALSGAVSSDETFPWPPGLAFLNGDVNADRAVDVSDAIYLLGWLFTGGPDPAPIACRDPRVENGDLNGDRQRDISDPVFLLAWLYSGGRAPVAACIGQLLGDEREDFQFDTSSEVYIRDQSLADLQVVAKVPDHVFQLLRPQPIYHVRIHAIRTADNDGSDAATITPAQVEKLVDQANVVYYSAGIVFDFDPQADFETIHADVLNRYFTVWVDLTQYTSPDEEPPVDSLWQDTFRTLYADLHRGKLVVFFSHGDKLKFDEAVGHWTVVPTGGGSSSSNTSHVNMPAGMPEINLLAHEMGHYLHNPHPFVAGLETVADAAAVIKKYVEVGGHPVEDGLQGLDGDQVYNLDTPPDAGARIFQNVHGDACGPDDSIDIPVAFSNGAHFTYRLEPNRGLIMSYFKGCHSLYHHLSPNQIRRTRDALENLNRHHLVTTPTTGRLRIDRKGEAVGGRAEFLEIVRVDHSRVVTTTISGGVLQLIAWDLSADGASFTRLGEAAAYQSTPISQNAAQVSSVHLGLGLVVTAVRTRNGNLDLIAWQVTAFGTIERKGMATTGPVASVAACRMAVNHLATALRNGAGNLEVILWEVSAAGNFTRRAGALAGAASEISVVPVYPYGLVTALRDGNGNLKLISWRASSDRKTLTRQMSAVGGAVQAITAAEVDLDLITTTVRTTGDEVKVIAWEVDQFGAITRRADDSSGTAVESAAVRLGTGLLFTASRNPTLGLSLGLWRIGAHGEGVSLATTSPASGAVQVAVCRSGLDLAVTAIRNAAGNLELTAWRATRITVGQIFD